MRVSTGHCVSPWRDSPRLEAVQHHAYQERIEADGLRPSQAAWTRSQWLHACAFRLGNNDQPGFADHDGGHGGGHRAVHEPGADSGAGGRRPQ